MTAVLGARPLYSAVAHAGALLAPHDLAWAWTVDPLLLVALAASTWWYSRGVRAVWRCAGRGQVVSHWQTVAFAAGVVAVLVALVSPLDALSGALFVAHMAQHLVLLLVAAPLFAVAAPGQAFVWGLPTRYRRQAARWRGGLTRSVPAASTAALGLGAFAVTLFGWHVPALYDAALGSEPVHVTEHVTLLAAGLLLWWPVARPRRTPPLMILLLLFVAAVLSSVLGALLTFAPQAWYAYGASTAAWSLTPLEDQQLAGTLMWVPGGVIFVLAPALVVARWLREDQLAAARARYRRAPGAGVLPGTDRKEARHAS